MTLATMATGYNMRERSQPHFEMIVSLCALFRVHSSPPSVPMLVLAGLFTFSTCVFVVCFRTRYRRLEAEERAVYGEQPDGEASVEEVKDN